MKGDVMPDNPNKQHEQERRTGSGYQEWERKEAERKARESEESKKGEGRRAGQRDQGQQ